MARISNEPLKPNPFFTYRDPETGMWRIVEQIGTNSSTTACQVGTNTETSCRKSAEVR